MAAAEDHTVADDVGHNGGALGWVVVSPPMKSISMDRSKSSRNAWSMTSMMSICEVQVMHKSQRNS